MGSVGPSSTRLAKRSFLDQAAAAALVFCFVHSVALTGLELKKRFVWLSL